FAALFLGYWGDRHPRIPLIGIGCILSGLAAVLTARGRSSFTFGLPRVIDDVSDTASQVPRFALLADYYPPEVRGKVYAIMGGLSRTATVLSPLVAGGLIVWLGWRWTFVIIGIFIAAIGVVALVKLREPVRGYMERKAAGADEEVARTEDEPQSFGEAWRSVMAVRTLRRTLLADVFSNVSDGVFTVLFPVFLAERYGLTALERGFILAPAALIGVFGSYIGGGLVDSLIRRNPGRVLAVRGVLEVVAALGLIGAALRPPVIILVVFYAINAVGLSLTGPAANAVYSQVIPPNVRTQGLQIFGLAVLPTLIIALPTFGTIRYIYGYDTAFFGLVPFAVIGAGIAASAGSFFALDRRAALAASVAADEYRRAKASGSTKLLVCRDVDVAYDGVQVLFGVDFDVDQGEILALLGTNGAGKSTLLRAISGTQEASGGAIVFDGRDITHMPPNEIAERGVISMPGGRGVFPGLTVRDNLVLGNWMNDDEASARQRMAEVLEMFPVLVERGDTLASSLSGGEQQMLSLAQAFLARPRLLLIDELSLGLSPAVVGQLLDIVRAIHARGTTVVVVEQSVNVALSLADRAIFMEKGEVRFFGETKELLRRPDILRAVYVKGTGALTDHQSSGVRGERDRRALELGTAPPVLEAIDIVKRFGGVRALDEASLTLREGEVLGVIGPNGSGKTTLFDIISGYQSADSGAVRYEGIDVTHLGADERAKRKLVRR
ncbi:MAG TPA: MFS transporter, partial [Acidimicrobiales bacterium]